jgi:CBS domain-containing membrane protein
MKKVKDCMNREVISVKRSTSLREILEKFKNFHRFPLVPVVSEQNELLGVVSLENLIQIFHPSHFKLLRAIPFLEYKEEIFDVDLPPEIGSLIVAEDIMSRNFITVNEEDEIKRAYKLMKLHKLEFLPVVDSQGKLVGIIGIFDIIRNLFADQGII